MIEVADSNRRKVLRGFFLSASLLYAVHGVLCEALARTVQYGDIHSHTCYSDDADQMQKSPLVLNYGRGIPPREALDYVRDAGWIDFVSLTDHAEQMNVYETEDDQGDPVQIDEFADTQNQCQDVAVNAPLSAFVGFEYTKMGNYADPGTGHKQVIYRNGTGRTRAIGSVSGMPLPDSPFAANPTELWAMLDNDGAEYITIPHHTAKGDSHALDEEGQPTTRDFSTDWTYVNAARQPVVEIFSSHGSSDYEGCLDPVDGFRPDRSVEAALNRWLATGNPGYCLGLIGSTDAHNSRPGSTEDPSDPRDFVWGEGDYTGGLTGVWAETNSPDVLWAAIKARRVFATSGNKIKIHDFSLTVGNRTALMGDLFTWGGPKNVPVTLRVEVETDAADIDGIVVSRFTRDDVRPNDGSPQSFTAKVTEEYNPRSWVVQTAESHPLATYWEGAHAVLVIPDTLSENVYYRVTVIQKPTLRYSVASSLTPQLVTTKEQAWSSPIFIRVVPGVTPALTLLLDQ